MIVPYVHACGKTSADFNLAVERHTAKPPNFPVNGSNWTNSHPILVKHKNLGGGPMALCS